MKMEIYLEESFGTAESLIANRDNLSVWEFVAFLDLRASRRFRHLFFEVQGHVRELFLDVAHYLALGRCGEGVSTLSENLH